MFVPGVVLLPHSRLQTATVLNMSVCVWVCLHAEVPQFVPSFLCAPVQCCSEGEQAMEPAMLLHASHRVMRQVCVAVVTAA